MNRPTSTPELAVTRQRFEYKYRVTEAQSQVFREYITPFVVHDSHCDARGMYALRSLYYDSPDLRLYQSSANGERNRHKLRVRWYGDERPDEVYVEIKRRNDQVIRKRRAILSCSNADDVLRHSAACASDLSAGTRDDLSSFRDLLSRYRATPRVLVRYHREAYSCVLGSPLRITFDRVVGGLPAESLEEGIRTSAGALHLVPATDVILEIKFTDAFPPWVSDIVRRMHLRPRSTCKYGLCVEELRRCGYTVSGRRPADAGAFAP